jgi:sugar lactone lactonase YvrE
MDDYEFPFKLIHAESTVWDDEKKWLYWYDIWV